MSKNNNSCINLNNNYDISDKFDNNFLANVTTGDPEMQSGSQNSNTVNFDNNNMYKQAVNIPEDIG